MSARACGDSYAAKCWFRKSARCRV